MGDPFEISKSAYKKRQQRDNASVAGGAVGSVGGGVGGIYAAGAGKRVQNAHSATKNSYKTMRSAMGGSRKEGVKMATRMGVAASKVKAPLSAAHGAGMYGGILAGGMGGAIAGGKLMGIHQNKKAKVKKSDPFEINKKANPNTWGQEVAASGATAGGMIAGGAVGSKLGESIGRKTGKIGAARRGGARGGLIGLAAGGLTAGTAVGAHFNRKNNKVQKSDAVSAFGVVHPE